jgi:hypothetical protein
MAEELAEICNASGDGCKDVQKGAQSALEDLDKTLRDTSHEF